MKRLFALSVLLLVTVCQHPSWAVQDPATPPLEIDHEQTINVVLEDNAHIKPNPLFLCQVKGEPVRAGTRVRFNFKIINPTTRDMVFDRVETGCGCMNMECEKPVIPANGAAIVNAVADYVVPRSHTREEYGINIQFKAGNKTVGGMFLTGPLEGVLSIPPVRAMESTGDFSEWRIPFIVTKPVELSRLQVQLSESLKDLVAKVDAIDGKAVILVSGPTSSLGLAGIIGEVILNDPLLEIKTAARVSFIRRPVIRISPLILLFTKANPKDESYSANVLIQSVDKKVENGQENAKNLIQSIECHVDKHVLKTVSTRINDQLYRVKLTLSPPEGEDVDESDFEIGWKVVSSRGVVEVSNLSNVKVKESLEEKARICSIFGVGIANAEAIKQGDVLFLERNFYDGVTFNAPSDEGTLDEFRLVRVVFDDEQGKFLVLSRTISEWLALGDVTNENDGRTIKTTDTGSFCNRSSGVLHSKQDNLIYRESNAADRFLVLPEDPRTVGMFRGGLGPFSRGIESHLNNLTGEKLIDWEKEKDGFYIRMETVRVPGKYRGVESFLFDPDSNLPTRFDSYGESEELGGGRTIPEVSRYRWKSMSGLHVAARITGSSFCGYRNPDEKPINAKQTGEYNFHWFSINEPIPAELFDEAILSDSKRFQDLIDPRTANATELIKIIEKLDPKYTLAPDKKPPAPK